MSDFTSQSRCQGDPPSRCPRTSALFQRDSALPPLLTYRPRPHQIGHAPKMLCSLDLTAPSRLLRRLGSTASPPGSAPHTRPGSLASGNAYFVLVRPPFSTRQPPAARCPRSSASPTPAVRAVRAMRERARARRPAREQQTAGGRRRAGGGRRGGGGGHGRGVAAAGTVLLPLLLGGDRAAPAGETRTGGQWSCAREAG